MNWIHNPFQAWYESLSFQLLMLGVVQISDVLFFDFVYNINVFFFIF
jgi:hypothetical protein